MAKMADTATTASQTLGAYDRLFSGCVMVETQARDLRTLARVFDLDAGPDVALPDLWRRLRPLVAQGAGAAATRLG